ncbi:MAG: NAD(P)H-hydrate dehydratase [Clostridia bacterium]|nr:NAD(P)H-hydrate dehydratase [Clostridia bacterium]
MRVYKEEQIRKAENKAFEAGISFLRLMENAGTACFSKINSRIREESSVLILCGKGKNGGDGLVIASKLCEAGHSVCVSMLFGEPVDDDCVHMYKLAKGKKIVFLPPENVKKHIKECDVIVDAVFGIGFKGTAKGFLPDIFDSVNKSSATVFSIDIPSGLVCDSNSVPDSFIKPDYTIAISGQKLCHTLKPASLNCGKILTAYIGVERDYYKDCEYFGYTLSTTEVSKMFIPRKAVSNKGDYGKVLCICGCKKYPGAAVLCVSGALRSGAGLVFSAFPDAAYPSISAKLTESPLLPLPSDSQGCFSNGAVPEILKDLDSFDAVVIGCGLSKTLGTRETVEAVIKNAKCPVIIDADGINCVAENIDILKEAKCKICMTPHPGEMARLTALSIDAILKNPVEVAKAFAKKYSVTLVLKGANTIVAHPDSDAVYINENGNSGLSKGGSGDLLAGILAGFVAQRVRLPAEAAVFIHGMCADATAKRLSKRGMLPSDCLYDLPFVLSKFETDKGDF